jgi:hypothetical protein
MKDMHNRWIIPNPMDIDLAYLPVEDRDASPAAIDTAL